MIKCFDIFENRLPKWVQNLAPQNLTPTLHCFTESQALSLGIPLNSKLLAFSDYLASTESHQACITHCKQRKYVSIMSGETFDITITSPYLSANGSALTFDEKSISNLDSMSRYISPFWLTESESYFLCRYLPEIFDYSHARKVFTSTTETQLVVDRANELVSVVNLQEIIRNYTSFSPLTFLRLFRIFEPINVRTKKPFLPSTAMLLRTICWRRRCWCSIWGTTEDFSSVGIRCLDGAITVNVFDQAEHDLLLTSSLNTSNVAGAYTLCFPQNHFTYSC